MMKIDEVLKWLKKIAHFTKCTLVIIAIILVLVVMMTDPFLLYDLVEYQILKVIDIWPIVTMQLACVLWFVGQDIFTQAA